MDIIDYRQIQAPIREMGNTRSKRQRWKLYIYVCISLFVHWTLTLV